MTTFKFEDYTLDRLHEYLSAINILILVYNDPRSLVVGTNVVKEDLTGDPECPFCKISGYIETRYPADRLCCMECPWGAIEGGKCTVLDTGFRYPDEKGLQRHIERLNRWKTKFEERIEALEGA